MSSRLKTTPLVVMITDSAGNAQIGKAVVFHVIRPDNGYQWNGSSWVASPQILNATEIYPGVYQYLLGMDFPGFGGPGLIPDLKWVIVQAEESTLNFFDAWQIDMWYDYDYAINEKTINLPAAPANENGKLSTIVEILKVEDSTLAVNGISLTEFVIPALVGFGRSDYYNNLLIFFTNGNNTGQVRRISDFDGPTNKITVDSPLYSQPMIGHHYIILTDMMEAFSGAGAIASAVWEEPLASHVSATSMGGNQNNIDEILNDTTNIKAKTNLIPAQPASEPTSLLIKAKTDNLPALPGNEATILAIKSKTDLLPLDPTSEASATSNKNDIKSRTSILDGTVMNDGLNTRTTFKTDFSIAINDFFVDQVIVFRTGSFAGLSRRISGYNGTTKFITVSPTLPTVGGLDSPPIAGAVFSIVARPAPAGISLNETIIAERVWNEPLAGHMTGGTSGAAQNRILPTEAKVDIVDTVADAIKVQTDKLQFNGSSEVLSEAMRLGATAETEVQQKATDALNAYDPPTRTEATSDKVEIISEVNANEVKVDAVKGVVDGIAIQTTAIDGRLPTDPADQSQVESAILAAQGVLQGEHVTIIAKENALLAAVLSIQNNTTTVIVVPPIMEKPETPGTKTYRLVLMNYDGVGGMEDFIQNTPGIYECQVKVDEIDGTPIIPYAYLVRDGVGVYHIDFVVNYTDANRPILFTFMLESLLSVIRYATRTSEITDEGTIIEQIKADTTDIRIDTGTTLPAQIEAVRVDINNEINITEASINSNVDNTRTQILNEIQDTQNMIEVIRGSIKTKVSVPNNIAIPLGKSKITEAIGLYDNEIPVENIDSFQEYGVVQIDNEKIFYTGKNSPEGKLTGCTRGWDINNNPAIPASHAENAKIMQIVVSRFMISYLDLTNNNIIPETIPELRLFNDIGTQIYSQDMIWDSSLDFWRIDIAFNSDDDFKNLRYSIAAKVNGTGIYEAGGIKTEYVSGTQSLIPGISTSGLMNGEFLFDQEGWIGTDGVFHDWTDEYKGYVRDENTGDRLQDVVVRAFRVLKDGTVARDYHPPYQSITDILGDFKGALDEGEYEFEFTLSGTVYFRVRRSIG